MISSCIRGKCQWIFIAIWRCNRNNAKEVGWIIVLWGQPLWHSSVKFQSQPRNANAKHLLKVGFNFYRLIVSHFQQKPCTTIPKRLTRPNVWMLIMLMTWMEELAWSVHLKNHFLYYGMNPPDKPFHSWYKNQQYISLLGYKQRPFHRQAKGRPVAKPL